MKSFDSMNFDDDNARMAQHVEELQGMTEINVEDL